MSTTSHEAMTVPNELVSPRAKLVYLYLTNTDGATPTELTEALELDKLTVLSILRSLSSRGFVRRADHTYTST